jgi:type VI secretion system secreted protein Hcp
MAYNTFIKFEGLKGQTTAEGFKEQIEISSFSQSVSQHLADAQSNQTRTLGRPMFSDITFTKPVDDSSPELLQACVTGQDFKTVEVSCCQMDDKKMVPIWVVTIDSALISSISQSAGGNDLPFESISLNFTKIKWEFKKQDSTGKKEGTKPASFDLTKITSTGK